MQPLPIAGSVSLDDLRELASAGQLYAILDACDTPAVPAKAEELGDNSAVSLYSGTAEEDYWAIAPYLVRVDEVVLTWIVETLWQEPWGIFVISSSKLQALRRHFRKFLMVEGPAGERWYFRFYDPRVFASFLSTCDNPQIAELFGPIQAYGVPDAQTITLLRYEGVGGLPPQSREAADVRPTPSTVSIRTEQLQALEEAGSPEFESYLVAHLREFSPLHSEALGESGIRALITAGIERAKKHGFTRRGPVQFYIEATILLGIDFDTDPQYPWPGQILRDSSIPDQTQRADGVHAWLMDLLDAAGGPERRYAKQALQRARQIPFQAISVSNPNFEGEIIRRMKENHPEKVTYLGEGVLRGLFPRAFEETQRYAVSTDMGVCLFIGLMFAVGHGFASDPKYPWIAKTLSSPVIADGDKRVERLYSKTMTYLDHVLQRL